MVATATVAVRFQASNGAWDTVEFDMNTLQMIRKAQARRQRLFEAQKMMAKAYRGVEYVDATHGPSRVKRTSDLKYRGLSYSV